jgi:hypothetical protein
MGPPCPDARAIIPEDSHLDWISFRGAGHGDAHEITVAIECRCYETAPVGIKDVDALYGFLDDVGANKAVLFSNSGFTAGATARADGKQVALRIFPFDADPEPFDWDDFLELDPCEIDGCWGMIDWDYGIREEADGEREPSYRVGFCERCSTLHIECPSCGVFEVINEWEDVECSGCENKWELNVDRKGLGVTSVRLKVADEDDEDA